MLMPKRTKYRRVQRGRMKGAASRGNKVSYGEFGIQAMEPGWITGNQIEAARVAMTRYTKRGGQVWIKIFPDKPVSKKALGVRMGSGKGAPFALSYFINVAVLKKFGFFWFVRYGFFSEWMRGRRIGVTPGVWGVWYALLLGGLLLAAIHQRKERKEL